MIKIKQPLDYRNPIIAHKLDTNPNYTRLVNTAKKAGVKHPGSKSLRVLKQGR